MNRMCREVQRHLPEFVDATLSRWRRPLVCTHLRRCTLCRAELDRQQTIAAGLGRLEAAADTPEEPPPGLLDTLLQHAEHPGVRGRAAIPARGAISGARPVLSVTFLLVAAVAGTGAGYAALRAGRALRRRLPGR